MCQFKKVIFQTALYDKVVDLREKVLRLPLGLQFSPGDLAIDRNELMYALIKADRPVACVQARPLDEVTVKIRQMAIDPAFQKQGLGKKILTEVEKELKAAGFQYIVLHARKTALDFYLKLGYQQQSGEFTEVGIPHYKMKKVL